MYIIQQTCCTSDLFDTTPNVHVPSNMTKPALFEINYCGDSPKSNWTFTCYCWACKT